MRNIELIKIRKDLGYSQQDMAEKMGISFSSLRRYETGERNIPEELNQRIKEIREELEKKIHVHIDYLKITFFGTTVKTVIEKVLGAEYSWFIRKRQKIHNYDTGYILGNIVIRENEKEARQGVLVEMTGEGVREFEILLKERGLVLVEWFSKIMNEWIGWYYTNFHSTRLDIAIDEMYNCSGKNFQLRRLLEKRQDKEHKLIVTPLRKFHVQDGDKAGENTGLTLYFGSRGTDNLYIRLYEKRYKLALDQGKSVEYILQTVGIWNRYELELGKNYTGVVFSWLDQGRTLGQVALDLFLSKFEVYDKIEDKQTGGVELVYCKDFYDLFDDYSGIEIKSPKKEWCIENSMRHLQLQYGGVLKLAEIYLGGKQNLHSWIDEIVENAEIDEEKEHQVRFERYLYEIQGIE
ncbi:replication initiation factor domain-containing protein [Enterococcus faecium]|uniref:replication initiation factor domain-containing protein n=1 Tax=Enterococcus faecium TaxID=1352 RepID=UPI0038D4C5A7